MHARGDGGGQWPHSAHAEGPSPGHRVSFILAGHEASERTGCARREILEILEAPAALSPLSGGLADPYIAQNAQPGARRLTRILTFAPSQARREGRARHGG